jgi:UDP-glucose:(heptosyl)LPS alpha-1,3-glucosyltransferase
MSNDDGTGLIELPPLADALCAPSAMGPAVAGRRLKIAFVVHDYNRTFGHSRYVAELATRFKHEHEVHVFTNTVDEPDPSDLIFHHVPAWRLSALAGCLTFIVPATFAVGRGFDIVHAQGLCGLRHNVATAHFCQPAWYAALQRMQGRLTWRQRLNQWLITPLERRALAQTATKRVIAISERIRADLAEHFGRRDGVRLVYHGVDLETFHPRNRGLYRNEICARLHLSPTACIALFVGYLPKGASVAIRAVARTPGVHLLLISNADCRAAQAVAQVEGIADRVTFVPYTRAIERYFAAADVFVFPTLWEPYGMVISEAMASGLPVITSRSAGAAELITHGQDGWLTDDPWDVNTVAAGLEELATNSERRRVMGTRARTTIEAYSWDVTAERTMAVYREITKA